MAKRRDNYAVLVTGSSGFVGQHMVGLLQTNADHVTEIRVLDIVPYENKTDYESTKPVKQFVGSILDSELVQEACTGVSCVIHLASLIDVSLFPDEKKCYQVNVEGTRTIIEACKKTGVERLLYCSSADVVIGNDGVFDATEDDTEYPKENFFPVYGKTKQYAEELVLNANCSTLKTVSIRPVAIYGDYDWKNIAPMFGSAFTKKTGYYMKLVLTFKKSDYVYAGNVASAFIQTDIALRTKGSSDIAGTSYFIKDDTPRNERVEFFDPILEECNLKPFPLSPKAWMILAFLRILFPVLTLLSFVCHVNCPFGRWVFHVCDLTRLVKDDKARRILRYKPIFDEEQIKRRLVKFIKSL
ncbi:3 beta-hydroxysteroid dehydrogenase/Delta 5--_4-isomerase type 3-like [Mercenaria mercenaria]|uniref:3 beta-hydroxysteroid dehydrogenase/Delta 5-->4-isomerase type 3-like n=1 Tax=Mercenaria mercenaria TaxID=6596 RepID=UPI00234E930D|nr:3 beta-hydroxysteroid dehydrogenase/Delta 5-->4-isomerase type 3-like [Mercenaria mercenaria]